MEVRREAEVTLSLLGGWTREVSLRVVLPYVGLQSLLEDIGSESKKLPTVSSPLDYTVLLSLFPPINDSFGIRDIHILVGV